MDNLNISDDFTIDDIHKIRKYNYERRKNMTSEEYKADVNSGADKVLLNITKLKEQRIIASKQ